MEIKDQRLYNQQLIDSRCHTTREIVHWLGAVQAQEYDYSKWGLSLRLPGAADAGIEEAFNNGAILRTHMMRPTWHYVTPEDIRWIQGLTKDRVHTVNGSMYRKLELDETVLRRGDDVIAAALQGGKHLTRKQLSSHLAQAGIDANGMRLSYLVMHAELECVICSGPRVGKQFTYMLLEERAPNAKTLPRDAALAELTLRFLTSHGPATITDFSWWSGLTIADVKSGIAMVKPHLQSQEIESRTYWHAPSAASPNGTPPLAFLLPPYDEYTIAYKNSDAFLEPEMLEEFMSYAWTYQGVAVYDGRIVGCWRRDVSKTRLTIELVPLRPLSAAEQDAFMAQAKQFQAFLGIAAELRFVEA